MKAKKIISLIVAMFMLLTIVSIPAFAAGEYSITPSGAASAKYETTYTLTIKANTPGIVFGVGCFVAYNADIFTPVTADITGCAALNANLAEIATVNGKTALKINSTNDNAKYTDETVWATIPFTVAAGTAAVDTSFELIYSDSDADLNGKITWLDDGFNEVAFADVAFGKIDVKVVPAHTAPTFDVAVSGTPTSGEDLEVSITNFEDNWDLTPEYAYQWLADGVEIDGATDATYALDADDYDKAISVKVTATVESDDDATNTVSKTSEATAKVAVPATAPAITVVETRDDVVAVGVALDTNATAEAATLVGGDTTLAYSWKVNGSEVATTKTYEPTVEDYATGTSVVTCVVTATSTRNSATATKTVTFSKAIVAGNMAPVASDVKVLKGDAEASAAVVGDVLKGSYAYNDVKDTATTEEVTELSTYQWYRDGVAIEGATKITYTVTAADKGAKLTFEVTPISSDDTPNEVLGLEGDKVTTGEAVASAEVAASANPAYVPVVSNVVVGGGAIVLDNAFKVSYDFEDKNGYDENVTITFKKNGEALVLTPAADGSYTITKDQAAANDVIVITVTPAKHEAAGELVYTGELKAVDSAEYKVYAKKSGGSAGLTGPVLGGGGSKPSTPTTSPEPTVSPEPSDAPVVVPAAKDCITLTIGKADVNVFGESKTNDVAPIIRNDRTMLPARLVAEALGATVAWDGEARVVTVTKGDVTIVITIDADKALVNGEEVALDSAAFIESDRTYLPMRFLGEKLGAEVTWNGATQEVYIVPAK